MPILVLFTLFCGFQGVIYDKKRTQILLNPKQYYICKVF